MTATAQGQPAKFVTGSTMRHVINMTVAGSIGLVAIFIVDALNLFYISLLGEQSLTAAVGFAATLLFFTISIAIGFTVATSALVSRTLGRGERAQAARYAGASLIYVAATSTVVTVLAWPLLHGLLHLLGATGETLRLAERFLVIVMPSTPIVSVGMAMTGVLRGVGDARRAMYVTLGAGIAAAIFDPILIFGLKLGLDGAAISTILSRFVLLFVGIYGSHFVHRLVSLPSRAGLVAAIRPFFSIGLPAILTQIATPIGYAYVTAEIARFGDDAVAGWTIAGRISPVAFGVIFALSGAVGPIIGQNFGARRYDRLTSTIRDSLTVTVIYVLAVWALLAIFAGPLATLFGATGVARDMVVFFCRYAAASFVFNGAIFVSSAAFNNLGYPIYSTIFNWGRSTFGVVPFVWLGARHFGAEGVIGGWGVGAVIFGILSMVVCFRTLATLASSSSDNDDAIPALPSAANSPFSTGKASTLR